jgi:hypothetical protein
VSESDRTLHPIPGTNSFSDILALAPIPTAVLSGIRVNGEVVSTARRTNVPILALGWGKALGEIPNIKGFELRNHLYTPFS